MSPRWILPSFHRLAWVTAWGAWSNSSTRKPRAASANAAHAPWMPAPNIVAVLLAVRVDPIGANSADGGSLCQSSMIGIGEHPVDPAQRVPDARVFGEGPAGAARRNLLFGRRAVAVVFAEAAFRDIVAMEPPPMGAGGCRDARVRLHRFGPLA